MLQETQSALAQLMLRVHVRRACQQVRSFFVEKRLLQDHSTLRFG